MSQAIDLLDDMMSQSMVVSSAPTSSPWAMQQPDEPPPPPPPHLSNSVQTVSNDQLPQYQFQPQQSQRAQAPAARSLHQQLPSQTHAAFLASQPQEVEEESLFQLPANPPSSNLGQSNRTLASTAAVIPTTHQSMSRQGPPTYPAPPPSKSNSVDEIRNSPGPLSSSSDQKLGQMTKILAKHAPSEASPLPFLPVNASGFILSRISFRTLLFKAWKQCYWVLYGTSQLLIFRSKEDADDWRYNPYHTKQERDFLVRLAIDFINDCKLISNCRGYKISPLGKKSYGRGETNQLHHFKLERYMDFGPVIAACFGSPDEEEVLAIRNVIIKCIKLSLKELQSFREGNLADPNYSMKHGPSQFSSLQSEVAPPTYPVNGVEGGGGMGENYVFDYETGQAIPAAEFQSKQSKRGESTTVARGRYDH